MLKIKDKHGRTKFILRDDDEEPLSIDDLVLKESEQKEKKDGEEQDTGVSGS